MTYEITDAMLARSVVFAEDVARFPEELSVYAELDSVRPKFDSVGAAVAHMWTLDGSSMDAECGTTGLGNGWHGLFRSERLIIGGDDFGFVTARRIPDDADMDAVWEDIERGARYEDDENEEGE